MATIEDLYRLQELELALRKCRGDLEDVAARIARDEAVDRTEALSARAERALTVLRGEQTKLDDDVQDTASRIKGLEQRLYSGATTASKDLFALQKEIGFLREKQGGLEERLLTKMEQVEAAEAKSADLSAEHEEAQARWQQEMPSLKERQQRLQEQATEVAQARDQAEAALTAVEVKAFRNLESSRGQAIVKIARGMCGGCGMSVPSHEQQLVRTSHQPVRCGSCGRYLYHG